jgi:hypothetical protein
MINFIKNFSIPGDKSGEPQKDILDDDLLFYVFTISMTFDDFKASFVRTEECFQLGFFL